MASLVADLDSFPRPPSDPSDSSFKFALWSNPPDPPVPPDPPPDILSLMGFLQFSDSKPYVSECGWIIDVLVELGLLDLGFSVLVPTVSVAFGYAIVVFVGTFTAVCRCCPFTAVCRFTSTFALMAFEMTWRSLLVWQFGVEVL
ncbi:hypothetical protein YC2023_036150 [Brassica napus]